ncbi:hypothetical protein PROFUN_16823 [Planoprotostelium fungivorum]|uniref:Uncharacterized protein n=1 Tax=Planoprotostelium fungivorum TaxID=1890364 RepID=A0A2P6MNW4_9EUKA|nr:hypothetical protein PROFUN_16823 [Planoprotostelium fungivorum]
MTDMHEELDTKAEDKVTTTMIEEWYTQAKGIPIYQKEPLLSSLSIDLTLQSLLETNLLISCPTAFSMLYSVLRISKCQRGNN